MKRVGYSEITPVDKLSIHLVLGHKGHLKFVGRVIQVNDCFSVFVVSGFNLPLMLKSSFRI